MAAEHLEARVSGRVQGVGFRAFVRGVARELDLSGGVKNGADRAVYVVAEGPRDKLDRLVAALRQGPAGARVEAVTTTWRATTGLDGPFEVWR